MTLLPPVAPVTALAGLPPSRDNEVGVRAVPVPARPLVVDTDETRVRGMRKGQARVPVPPFGRPVRLRGRPFAGVGVLVPLDSAVVVVKRPPA